MTYLRPSPWPSLSPRSRSSPRPRPSPSPNLRQTPSSRPDTAKLNQDQTVPLPVIRFIDILKLDEYRSNFTSLCQDCIFTVKSNLAQTLPPFTWRPWSKEALIYWIPHRGKIGFIRRMDTAQLDQVNSNELVVKADFSPSRSPCHIC